MQILEVTPIQESRHRGYHRSNVLSMWP